MKRLVASSIVALAAAFGPCLSGAVAPMPFERPDAQQQSVASWSGLEPHSAAAPAPAMTWLMAIGFLGVVVLRRTRSGPMM
jgi:hypothetical protein